MGLNPQQLVQLLKCNNPRAVAEQIINTNFPNDPTMKSLLNYAEKGDTESLQQFAENYFKQQGKDFNTELQGLMSAINKL
jgi:hypothetical protein